MMMALLMISTILALAKSTMLDDSVLHHRGRDHKYRFKVSVLVPNDWYSYCCGLRVNDKFWIEMTNSGNLTIRGAHWHQANGDSVDTCGTLRTEEEEGAEEGVKENEKEVDTQITFNWTQSGVWEDTEKYFNEEGISKGRTLGKNFTLSGIPLEEVKWQINMRFAASPRFKNSYVVWVNQNLSAYGISDQDAAKCQGVWILDLQRPRFYEEETQ
jgi:hypothetical protein